MKMSTYLVAFVVGRSRRPRPVDVDGVPVRVVHAPGKEHLGRFALEVGAFALRFFTEYFDIPYPGDKVDLVAIPDFAFGAMENLGCVTFRDTALLVDPEQRRPHRARAGGRRGRPRAGPHVVRRPRDHGLVGGHLAQRGLRHVHGDALRRRLPARRGTAGSGSPLRARRPWPSTPCTPPGPSSTRSVRPTRPTGCSTSSPTRRACSVLRMLEQYIGPEVFRDGVRTYLKTHAYANTVTADLWDALEAASGAAGARHDEHLHPPGRPSAGLARGHHASPGAVRARARCRPEPPRRSAPSGRSRLPCAPCPDGDRPGAPTGHLVLGRRARSRGRSRGGSGRGQRRRLGRVPSRVRVRPPPGPGRSARPS